MRAVHPTPVALLLALSFLCHGGGAGAQPAEKVQVFPFSSARLPKPIASLPQLFTEVVVNRVRATGRPAELAEASLADTASLMGCAPDQLECLELVASTLAAGELIGGSVARGKKGTTAVVTLIRFAPGAAPITQTVSLRKRKMLELANELGTLLAPLLAVGLSTTPSPPAAPLELTPPPDAEPPPLALAAPPPVAPPEPPAAPPPAEPEGLVLVAPPAGTAPALTRVADEQRFSLDRVSSWTWIVGGAGLAAAAAGTVSLVLAAGLRDEVASAPTDTVAQLERLAEMEQEGWTYSNLGVGLLAGGGLLTATALVFLVVQGSPSAPDGAAIHLQAGARRGGGWATMEVRW